MQRAARRFGVVIMCLVAIAVTLPCTPVLADSVRLGWFTEEITIPVGHRCMGILPTLAVDVHDELEARGVVVVSDQLPLVLIALDWCEVRNGAYDQWRNAVARAVGTQPERVLISSIHQHDAPVTDNGAQEYLDDAGLPKALFDREFQDDCIARVAVAAREAMTDAVEVTHIASGMAKVQGVASSRRVVHPDGAVRYDRYSASAGNQFMQDAPDGDVDPWLRTITFFHGDRRLVSLHSYATHPMSSYGKGHVSADFPGVARRLVSRSADDDFPIYLSGCSGDVTAGRYNDGSAGMKAILGERLAAAMTASSESAEKRPINTPEFRCAKLNLPFIDEAGFSREELLTTLRSPEATEANRILAAMALSSLDRIDAGQAIDVPCIDFGDIQIVLLPGESFVGYQLSAQGISRDKFVMCLGYGECWPGYVPTRQAFDEHFDHGWRWVSPAAPDEMQRCLIEVLTPSQE